MTKDPHRHVYMIYQDEPEKALLLSVLAPDLRVNKQLLRYHSPCNSSEINAQVCTNTYGSYTCGCDEAAGYLPSIGNGSCVKKGDLGTYLIEDAPSDADDKYGVCVKRAFTEPESDSPDDCYCPTGSDLRVTAWSNATQECSRCGAGSWAIANSTCQTCFPDSWSLPGTPDRQYCLCNQVGECACLVCSCLDHMHLFICEKTF